MISGETGDIAVEDQIQLGKQFVCATPSRTPAARSRERPGKCQADSAVALL